MAERIERDNRRGGRKGRKKVCAFCVDKVEVIDYKDILNPRAKVLTGEAGYTAGIKSVEIYSSAVRAWDDLAKKQLGMSLDDISFPTVIVLGGVK